MTAKLIPPQLDPVSFRAVLVAACLGAGLGAVFGAAMWLVTEELLWLWAVPVFAFVGASVHDKHPNVLWWKRAP
jgi:hypothetical protein